MTTGFTDWDKDALPEPPQRFAARWTSLIGPGLLMVGANIGGGEWLFGPLVTAQYGGRVMWIATLAIILQVFYNLAVMRYALFAARRSSSASSAHGRGRSSGRSSISSSTPAECGPTFPQTPPCRWPP